MFLPETALAAAAADGAAVTVNAAAVATIGASSRSCEEGVWGTAARAAAVRNDNNCRTAAAATNGAPEYGSYHWQLQGQPLRSERLQQTAADSKRSATAKGNGLNMS